MQSLEEKPPFHAGIFPDCQKEHSLLPLLSLTRIEIFLDVRTKDRFPYYSDCHKQNSGIQNTQWDNYMSTYSKETEGMLVEITYLL